MYARNSLKKMLETFPFPPKKLLKMFVFNFRAPFELFNFHYILKNWGITTLSMDELLPGVIAESYKAVMKWAVYAPALLHPLLYFTFSPEARHGAYILFR